MSGMIATPRDLEMSCVRLASRAAALVLAAVAVYGASFVRERVDAGVGPPGGAGVTAFVEFIEQQPAPRTVRAIEAVRGRGSADGAFEMPLLWINAPDGRIVFRSAEQYHRCLAARRRRADEADCPNAYETRELALARDARG